MYVQEIGSKNVPTIVFLHGGGMSGWVWREQIEYFKDYHCLVPDLPGHGKSTEPLVSLRDCAEKIADLVETRANKKVYLVGHSLGAKVAVKLLHIKPELIDHAVIVSTLCRPIKMMSWFHRLWIYKLTVWMSKSNKVIELQATTLGFKDPLSQKYFIADMQKLNAEGLYKIYDLIYQNLEIPPMVEVKSSVLIVAGAKEPEAMRQSVKDLVSTIPHAKGILVLGANHTLPWTRADLFNKLIRQWITNTPLERDFVYDIQFESGEGK